MGEVITLTDICVNLGVEYSLQGLVENVPYMKGPKSLDDTSAAAELSFSFCEYPGVNSLTRRPVDNLDNVLYPYTATETEIQETIKKVLISVCPVVICPLIKYPSTNKTLIKVVNPRLAFMNVMQALYKVFLSIHPTAVIADCVEIRNNVSIGPNTVIGFEGFGMWRRETGELMKFPQIGRVIIKNDVEIKANVCIDRGALGDTIIGEGSKIDNLVHISHNVVIGKNVAIVAKAMIGGSARIGDESWIAPNASVLNGVVIGKRCVIGMGSVVLKDVPDDTTVKGVPAR